MIQMRNFDPVETITINAAATSNNGAFSAQQNGMIDLELYNPTDQIAFFVWGKGAQTATIAGYPVGPGLDKIVQMQQSDNVACILGAASGNAFTKVYATRGYGS